MSHLSLDLAQAVEEIKKRGAKRVVIQLPEGLKTRSFAIVDQVQKETGTECIVLADPVFGACDLAEFERRQFKADLVLHFGHTQFVKKDFGHTIYIPLYYELDEKLEQRMEELLVTELNKRKVKSIGLAGTIQFKPFVDKLREKLETQGFKIEAKAGKLTGPGQLLGCDALSVKSVESLVDVVVYVGDGNFHSLPLQFTIDKPILALNPMNETLEELKGDKDRYVRQRYGLIAVAMKAEKFGILVSTKEGQFKLEQALHLKKMIEQAGRKAYVFSADLLLPDYFIGMGIDCFVCTACPRIAIEDAKKWNKPLINGIELEIALGKRKLEKYEFEELV